MVGRIRVQSLLGRGGMGELYAGYDETLDRRVALKAIRAERRLHPQARARFLREARALSQLDHPNICRIYDYVEQEEGDFLVLELIEGRSLDGAIQGGLSREQQLRIAEQVGAALVAAHAEGVVHRDLKPSNVMLTAAGEAKVLDFGLAWMAGRRVAPPPPAPPGEPAVEPTEAAPGRPGSAAADAQATLDAPSAAGGGASPSGLPGGAEDGGDVGAAAGEETPWFGTGGDADQDPLQTHRGTIMGTPAYMSPEQARGEAATTASDMYSFGLLLQALCTGRAPYPAEITTSELLQRALHADTLPVTGVRGDVAGLIERLKSPAPAARPTAVEAAARLRWIRDAPKRRLRRLAAAAALAAAVLGAVKYTLDLRHERGIAVAARADAERRRDQAEDLIQFMLGDLRERLEPVGRLDALDGVADKALDYFASMGDEQLTDADLFRRSRALTQIGEVRVAQGDLAAAERSLDEAHALAVDLVRRRPEEGEWLMGLGAIEFWLGNVHWLQADLAAAEDRFRAYLEVAERLVEIDASHPEWRLELAYAHSNLGSIQQARGHLEEALEHFRLTVAAKRELVRADPGNGNWQKELASSLSWLAETLLGEGELAEAGVHYGTGRDLLQRLVEREPDNAQYRYMLAIAHNKVAWVLEMRGAIEEAARELERSLALNRQLVELDPGNADWQREAAVGHQRLGRTLAWRAAAAGLPHLRRGVDGLARLAAADGSNSERRRDMARARLDLARVLTATGQAASGVAEARRVLEALGSSPAADGEDRRRKTLEGEAQVVMGDALAGAGRHGEATEAWERAAAALAPLAEGSRDPRVLAPLAHALLRLGRDEQAGPVVDTLTATGYRLGGFESARRTGRTKN